MLLLYNVNIGPMCHKENNCCISYWHQPVPSSSVSFVQAHAHISAKSRHRLAPAALATKYETERRISVEQTCPKQIFFNGIKGSHYYKGVPATLKMHLCTTRGITTSINQVLLFVEEK
ncbi:unnamed protein product [Ixodes pacificus]